MAMALIIVGWFPLLYRRFSRGALSHPLGRALFWGFVLGCFAQLMADLGVRYHLLGWLCYFLLVPPLLVNLFVLSRYVFRRKQKLHGN